MNEEIAKLKEANMDLTNKLMEVIEEKIRLEYHLRDATDLLNACGYKLIDGVWRDMEYYPDDLE